MNKFYMLYIFIISFMIIYFIHNIFNFLQCNLTNPLLQRYDKLSTKTL